METLDGGQIQTADSGFDLFFDRDGIEDLLICYEGHDLGTYLCLHDGQLGTLQVFGSLIKDHLGEIGILHLHTFLVDDEHAHGLLHSLQLFLLFSLLLLSFFPKKIKNHYTGDKYHRDYYHYYLPGLHIYSSLNVIVNANSWYYTINMLKYTDMNAFNFRTQLKRFTACILAFALVFSSPAMVFATETIDDLQQEIDSLNNEIDDLEDQKKDAQNAMNSAKSGLSGANSQISSISGAMGDLGEEIEGINQELVGLLTDIELIEADIRTKEEQIAQTEIEYDEAVKQRDTQYETMKIRVKYMYEQGDATYISIFLESTSSFSDALNKIDYVEQLYAYDRAMLEEFMATVEYTQEVWDRLEEEKSELETSKEELQAEQEYLETIEAQLETEYDNYSVMLAQAKQQAAIYTAKINQQTNEIRQLEREEAAKKKEADDKKKDLEAEKQRLKEEEEAAAKAATETDSADTDDDNDDGDTGTNEDDNSTDTSSGSSSGSSSGTTVAGSGTGSQIANYALKFVGNPYVPGGTSLTDGADCSGFVYSVYKAFGYNLPRTSYSQSTVGRSVSYSEAQPGDILYYGGHVGIYIGNGQIVHASTQRSGIKISPATYRSIVTIRRIV